LSIIMHSLSTTKNAKLRFLVVSANIGAALAGRKLDRQCDDGDFDGSVEAPHINQTLVQPIPARFLRGVRRSARLHGRA
jgi:hypothetical protein